MRLNAPQGAGGRPRPLLSTPRNVPTGDAGYIALKELADSPEPIGCWRIRAALHAAGIVASEATAGRLLRQLDHEGLTRALDSRGRILTDKGRRRLAALEDAHRRHSYHKDLLQAVRAESIQDVRDLLTARRAVEAETARLAALRGTARDIQDIEKAVHRHIQEMRTGGDRLDHNRAIHRLIAQASRSRILQAVVNVLLQEEYLQELQTHIQRAVDGFAPEDHLLVLQAIKDRQPDRAAEAMRAHIDRLLRAVQSYRVGSKRKPKRATDMPAVTLPP